MSREQILSTDRRSFVGYLIKGTTLGVALRFVGDGVSPAIAGAQLDIPEIADELDLVDLLILSGTPFYYDYLIEITPDNRIRFELPRMEVGQGIETAAVMMLAEELDCRISDVDVSLSPGEIRRSTGQITGGSHAVTSLWDPLRRVAQQPFGTRSCWRRRPSSASFRVTSGTENTMAIAPDGTRLPYSDLSDGVEGPAATGRSGGAQGPGELRHHRHPAGAPGRRGHRDRQVAVRNGPGTSFPAPTSAWSHVLPPSVATLPPTTRTGPATCPGVIAIQQVPLDVEGASSGVRRVVARSTGEAFRARDALTITWTDGPAVGPLRRRHHRATPSDQRPHAPRHPAADRCPSRVSSSFPTSHTHRWRR